MYPQLEPWRCIPVSVYQVGMSLHDIPFVTDVEGEDVGNCVVCHAYHTRTP